MHASTVCKNVKICLVNGYIVSKCPSLSVQNGNISTAQEWHVGIFFTLYSYMCMSKFHRFFIIPVDDDLNRFESLLYNDVFKHLTICPEYWFLKIFNHFLSVLPGKNLTPLLWSQYTPEDYKLTNLNLQNLKMNRNILLLLLT